MKAGRWAGASWPRTATGLLLAVVTPFFFVGGPGYHSARSFQAVWNLGHILFFGLLTWLVLDWADSRGRRPRFWTVAALMMLVGLAVELAQMGSDGRMVDPWDLARDLLGSVSVLVMEGCLPGPRLLSRVVMLVLVVLLGAAGWPLVRALSDERMARHQFPVLADFETPFEAGRWRDPRQVRRDSTLARHGRWSLRVNLSTATYSGVTLFYFPGDWRDWKELRFSVHNPGPEPLVLYCRIHDALHREHGNRYDDRFHRRFELSPGWHDLVIPLQDVRTAPATRLMDMARIENVGFFVIRQPHRRVIHLDNLVLTR